MGSRGRILRAFCSLLVTTLNFCHLSSNQVPLWVFNEVLGDTFILEKNESTSLATSSFTWPIDQNVIDFSKFGEILFELDFGGVLGESTNEDLSLELFILYLLQVLFGKKFLNTELITKVRNQSTTCKNSKNCTNKYSQQPKIQVSTFSSKSFNNPFSDLQFEISIDQYSPFFRRFCDRCRSVDQSGSCSSVSSSQNLWSNPSCPWKFGY